MTETSSLAIFTKAALMLAEADTIQKTKELKDMAIVAGEWARRKGMGENAIKHCRSYAAEAERKMGEMLAQTERQKPGEYQTKQRSPDVTVAPTLADLGLTKRESAEAQELAAMPPEVFEEIKHGKKTRTAYRRESKRAEVSQNILAMPTGKYRVVYADPPWAYNDKCDAGSVQSGGCEKHYPSMTITELCAMPIRDLCEPDAVLFLWVTSPLLFECHPIIPAWGFVYKSSFVWDKIKHNMGHYNSVRHEFLLVCTRGSCLPDAKELIDSVQSIERTTHSTKPEEFRAIIDKLYPHGKHLELFARKPTPGWEAYGNQL